MQASFPLEFCYANSSLKIEILWREKEQSLRCFRRKLSLPETEAFRLLVYLFFHLLCHCEAAFLPRFCLLRGFACSFYLFPFPCQQRVICFPGCHCRRQRDRISLGGSTNESTLQRLEHSGYSGHENIQFQNAFICSVPSVFKPLIINTEKLSIRWATLATSCCFAKAIPHINKGTWESQMLNKDH